MVLFIAFPRMGLLDLTGPQTVFWAASKRMRERGLPGYVIQTASVHGGLVLSAEGIAIATRRCDEFAYGTPDTIVVPGATAIEAVLDESGATIDWVRQAAAGARRVVSVCGGAFVLAQAGLLDGLRVTTHRTRCDLLQQRYPKLLVERDTDFIRHDAVWTSASAGAGIDAALAMVEADCGRDVAATVARELMVA